MPHKLDKRECPQCLSEFQPRSHLTKFCGKDCWSKSMAGKVRPNMRKRKEKTCPVCRGIFECGGRSGITKDAVYCSRDCRHAGRFRRGKRCAELVATDAAYLAGLLDGEGSVMIVSRDNGFALRLNIANTHRAVLDWVATTTGVGRVVAGKRQSEWHQPIWAWRAGGDSAETVLSAVVEFMKIKSRHARYGIEFHQKLRDPSLKADSAWQAVAAATMKDMNARGRRAVELARRTP